MARRRPSSLEQQFGATLVGFPLEEKLDVGGQRLSGIAQDEEIALPGQRIVHCFVTPDELPLRWDLDRWADMQDAFTTIQGTANFPAGATEEFAQFPRRLQDFALREHVVLGFDQPAAGHDVVDRCGQAVAGVGSSEHGTCDVTDFIEVL